MPIETIEFKGDVYPKFQSEGNAAQFAIPFAKHFCKGVGYDIGYNKPAWKFPGAVGIDNGKIMDPINGEEYINVDWNATNLPQGDMDYIISSHCLEHLPNWVDVLDYWATKLKSGGVLFLYLPDFSQKYWRPWSNRKHLHAFTPEIIKAYFKDNSDVWKRIAVSEIDLNNSFMIVAEKI